VILLALGLWLGWNLAEGDRRRARRERREERDRLLIENALLRAELDLERHPRRRRWGR